MSKPLPWVFRPCCLSQSLHPPLLPSPPAQLMGLAGSGSSSSDWGSGITPQAALPSVAPGLAAQPPPPAATATAGGSTASVPVPGPLPAYATPGMSRYRPPAASVSPHMRHFVPTASQAQAAPQQLARPPQAAAGAWAPAAAVSGPGMRLAGRPAAPPGFGPAGAAARPAGRPGAVRPPAVPGQPAVRPPAGPAGPPTAGPVAAAAEPAADAPLGFTGLRNETGEYNCFLNVIVQCLWRCAEFRRMVGGCWLGRREGRCLGRGMCDDG